MIRINNVKYDFDPYGVIDKWFGCIIKKRKYIYVYAINTPNINDKIKIFSQRPVKILHYNSYDLIEGVPAIIYSDYYRYKKVFRNIELISKPIGNFIPVLSLKMKLKKGSNKIKKYCDVFCYTNIKTSITPVALSENEFEFRLYDYGCPDNIKVNDRICSDIKAVYMAMLFVSAQTGKRVINMFDPIIGKQYVYYGCCNTT